MSHSPNSVSTDTGRLAWQQQRASPSGRTSPPLKIRPLLAPPFTTMRVPSYFQKEVTTDYGEDANGDVGYYFRFCKVLVFLSSSTSCEGYMGFRS